MDKKTLFALTVLKMIQLGFRNTEGHNPYYIGFENRKGNTVYVSIEDDKVKVAAFRVSRRCLFMELDKESDVDAVADELSAKLKLNVR